MKKKMFTLLMAGMIVTTLVGCKAKTSSSADSAQTAATQTQPAKEDEQPTDPLAKEVIRYMSDENLTNVSWNFVSFPSQNFKDMFGADLLSYAQGKMDWNTVKDNMVKNWAEEKAAIAE